MTRVSNSREDLLAHLSEQMILLREHCAQFDSGKQLYAKPIANLLRMLLHNHGSSNALLAQLHMLQTTRWLDTAGVMVPGNLASSNNLAWMTATVVNNLGDTTPSWTPILDDYAHKTSFNRRTAFGVARVQNAGRRLLFDEWWAEMPVIRQPGVFDYTRRYLVLELAQTDGGVHVDPGLREDYFRLTRTNAIGGVSENSTGDIEMGSPIGAAVRQIAHEVIRSLPSRHEGPRSGVR